MTCLRPLCSPTLARLSWIYSNCWQSFLVTIYLGDGSLYRIASTIFFFFFFFFFFFSILVFLFSRETHANDDDDDDDREEGMERNKSRKGSTKVISRGGFKGWRGEAFVLAPLAQASHRGYYKTVFPFFFFQREARRSRSPFSSKEEGSLFFRPKREAKVSSLETCLDPSNSLIMKSNS